MAKKLKFSLLATAVLAAVLTTGCDTQPVHPNQLNAFDGAVYNSLTLAHAALTSFRVRIPTATPQYIPVFNEAAAGYRTAFDGYAAFRSQPDSQAAVSAALISLTASIVNLENAFAAGLQADPQAIAKIRQRASIIRGRASERLSVSDILTELQIAAAVAATVRGEATYSDVAAIVVEATSQALAAEKATAGQPIDLTTIQPVLPIQ
jgi:hypothetical protein